MSQIGEKIRKPYVCIAIDAASAATAQPPPAAAATKIDVEFTKRKVEEDDENNDATREKLSAVKINGAKYPCTVATPTILLPLPPLQLLRFLHYLSIIRIDIYSCLVGAFSFR